METCTEKSLERSRQEIREKPHLTVFFYLLRPTPEGLPGCLIPNFAFFKTNQKKLLFIYFWLHQAFVVAHGLLSSCSMQAVESRCTGLVIPQHVGS